MADLPPDTAVMGIKLGHLLAGALGGLSRAIIEPGVRPLRVVTTTIVGSLAAGYSTPVVAPILAHMIHERGWPGAASVSTEAVAGYLLGTVAVGAIAAAGHWLSMWRACKLPKPPAG